MLVEHPAIDRQELLDLISRKFPGAGGQLDFVPVGEDSWCYRLGTLWISVRRDLDGHYPGAYEAARELRARGRSFVLAPLAGIDGRVVYEVGGLPVVVFPFLDGAPLSALDTAWSDKLVTLLADLHGADTTAAVPVEDFRLPFDGRLESDLRSAANGRVHEGPYGAPLKELITRSRVGIERMRAEAAELGAACAADPGPRALTHGDPGPANAAVRGSSLYLLDWGGLMWAPPERDWFAIHRAFGFAPDCAAHRLRFYQLRWALAEIAEYTGRFIEPHLGDADDHAMWQRLQWYLPIDQQASPTRSRLDNRLE